MTGFTTACAFPPETELDWAFFSATIQALDTGETIAKETRRLSTRVQVIPKIPGAYQGWEIRADGLTLLNTGLAVNKHY